MTHDAIFFDFLKGRQVSDHAFAAAYDGTPSLARGGMKAAIARAFTLLDKGGIRDSRNVHTWEQGFCTIEAASPAPWALLCLDALFSSPARLLAALMPALAAGVRRIAVVRVAPSTLEWPPHLLTALELAGQEDVCQVTKEDLCVWLEALAAAWGGHGPGRCIFLGGGFSAAPELAARLGVPVARHDRAPWVRLLEPDAETMRMLAAAHPDALHEPAMQKRRPDAVIASPDRLHEHAGQASLLLSPEHVWFWRFFDLPPSWFRNCSLALWNESDAGEGA